MGYIFVTRKQGGKLSHLGINIFFETKGTTGTIETEEKLLSTIVRDLALVSWSLGSLLSLLLLSTTPSKISN